MEALPSGAASAYRPYDFPGSLRKHAEHNSTLLAAPGGLYGFRVQRVVSYKTTKQQRNFYTVFLSPPCLRANTALALSAAGPAIVLPVRECGIGGQDLSAARETQDFADLRGTN